MASWVHCPNGRGGATIIDSFTFFNEPDVLEIRLRELNAVVDRWVVVEASVLGIYGFGRSGVESRFPTRAAEKYLEAHRWLRASRSH